MELPRANDTCRKREKLFITVNFDYSYDEEIQPDRVKRCNAHTFGERTKVDVAPTAFSIRNRGLNEEIEYA